MLKSWSSGSWKTRPTRRRTSGAFRALTSMPSIRIDAAGPAVRPRANGRGRGASRRPAAVGQEAVEVEQERALARAVGADQGDALARRDRQVDAVEGEPAVGVAIGQARTATAGGRRSRS